MRLGIISDIHSNKYALQAVLNAIGEVDELLILGDLFGYYPWAVETYDMLKDIDCPTQFISGNHDALVLQPLEANSPKYHKVAQLNRAKLTRERSEAISWLEDLPCQRSIIRAGRRIKMVHGTIADPLNGRFYPDHPNPEWFNELEDLCLFGHTHYAMQRLNDRGGFVLNPGSVGQPRDGDSRAQWAIFDLATLEVEFFRIAYDVQRVIAELEEMEWYDVAINALRKKR